MDSTMLEQLERIAMPARQFRDAKAQASKAQAFVDFVFGVRDRSGSRGRKIGRYIARLGRRTRRGYHPA